jgi:hypothetical protein
LYHERNAGEERSSCDTFLFFNPGFGHSNLQKSWEQTLQCIVSEEQQTPRRLLLTAHSEKDALRDTAILKDRYGLSVEYAINSFASRIQYQDPFDRNHYVSPNHYVAVVSIP